MEINISLGCNCCKNEWEEAIEIPTDEFLDKECPHCKISTYGNFFLKSIEID
ncbi:hypothetical protein [Chengkuizengella marina]|uniref:hypothetical protein n=1 Tax=Chengkuizengella marina TaxID=2507566 RepID=UPI00136D79AF|nr:hypothetical protein [Chengkuizengella marina]